MAWAPDYCSLQEAKDYIQDSTSLNDAVIATAITASSRTVDAYCRRQFGRITTSVTRSYTPRVDYERRVLVVDITDMSPPVTGTVVEVDGIAVVDYVLEPVNNPADSFPYTTIRLAQTRASTVDVTSDAWGWSSIPAPVVQATLLQTSRIVWRRQAPAGVSGSPQVGSEVRLLAAVDPDVKVLLADYQRIGTVG